MISKWCQQSSCGRYTVTHFDDSYTAWKRMKYSEILYFGKNEQDAYSAIREHASKNTQEAA